MHGLNPPWASEAIQSTPLSLRCFNQNYPKEFQYFRSKLRYWIASAMCGVSIRSAPSKSAIVLATFNMRSWARALNPSVSNDWANNSRDGFVNWQYRRIAFGCIVAFVEKDSRLYRSICRACTRLTRSRIVSDDSFGPVSISV